MVAWGLACVGCGAPSEEEAATGPLSLRLGAASVHDVDSVLFVVVDVDAAQKLLGTAGICGAPMPRGRDPLPADEQAVIEDWINSI